MSDQITLLVALAAGVRAVPGVCRLEPTLSTAGLRALVARRDTDGVLLVVRAGLADVEVNLATDQHHQARAVAERVHTTLVDLLVGAGLRVGAVTVNVLSIEPA